MKVKKVFEKIIICMILFLLIFNFVISPMFNVNTVYADDTNTDEDTTNDYIDSNTTGFGGILLSTIRVGIIAIGSGMQNILYSLMSASGVDGDVDADSVSVYDILFNKFKITNVNIFKTNDVEEGSIVYSIRKMTLLVFNVVLAIGVVILGVIMGISMFRSLSDRVLAEEKSNAKETLATALVAVCIIALVSSLILLMIEINNTVVDWLSNLAENTGVSSFVSEIKQEAQDFSAGQVRGWTCTFIYIGFMYQTFIFAISYIIRFLHIVFLIIISPLIPNAYVRDKSEGKSYTALNDWFGNMFYELFRQPLDCLIYIVIVSVFENVLATQVVANIGWATLGVGLLCVISLDNISTLRNSISKIFGFNSSRSSFSFTSIVNSASSYAKSVSEKTTSFAQGSSSAVVSSPTKFGVDISGGTSKGVANRFNTKMGLNRRNRW